MWNSVTCGADTKVGRCAGMDARVVPRAGLWCAGVTFAPRIRASPPAHSALFVFTLPCSPAPCRGRGAVRLHLSAGRAGGSRGRAEQQGAHSACAGTDEGAGAGLLCCPAECPVLLPSGVLCPGICMPHSKGPLRSRAPRLPPSAARRVRLRLVFLTWVSPAGWEFSPTLHPPRASTSTPQGPANLEAICQLVELGADVEATLAARSLETPLHIAARSGRGDVLGRLIQCPNVSPCLLSLDVSHGLLLPRCLSVLCGWSGRAGIPGRLIKCPNMRGWLVPRPLPPLLGGACRAAAHFPAHPYSPAACLAASRHRGMCRLCRCIGSFFRLASLTGSGCLTHWLTLPLAAAADLGDLPHQGRLHSPALWRRLWADARAGAAGGGRLPSRCARQCEQHAAALGRGCVTRLRGCVARRLGGSAGHLLTWRLCRPSVEHTASSAGAGGPCPLHNLAGASHLCPRRLRLSGHGCSAGGPRRRRQCARLHGLYTAPGAELGQCWGRVPPCRCSLPHASCCACCTGVTARWQLTMSHLLLHSPTSQNAAHGTYSALASVPSSSTAVAAPAPPPAATATGYARLNPPHQPQLTPAQQAAQAAITASELRRS